MGDFFLYKKIMDRLEVPMLIHTLNDHGDLEFFDMNQRAENELNYTKEELQQLSPKEYMSLEFLKYVYSKKNSFVDEDSIQIARCCKNKENTKVLGEVNVSMFRHNDKIYYLTSACKITDQQEFEKKRFQQKLRQSHERYEQLVSLLPDGVIISKNGICLFANEAAVKLLGYTTPSQLIGENLLPFLHPDFQNDLDSRKETLYSKKTALPFIEQEVIKKDGTAAYVEASSIPLFHHDQWTTLTVTRDITSYKGIAKKLEDTNEQLQIYILENDEILYELRRFRHNYINVLHGMRGYMDDHDWEGLNQYFEYLVGKIQELNNIHILSIQKIRNLSLRGILTVKLREAKTRNIDIHIEILKDLDIPQKQMESVDLCEVMGVFLDNAIEAAQESADPKLNICFSEDTNIITIIIENTYKEKPNIALFKSGYSTKGEKRGTGLVLAAQILSHYPHILNNTFINDSFFIQEIQINK